MRYEPFYTKADHIVRTRGLPLKGKCACRKPGIRRYLLLADMQEAINMSYISCQSCFDRTWRGEA